MAPDSLEVFSGFQACFAFWDCTRPGRGLLQYSLPARSTWLCTGGHIELVLLWVHEGTDWESVSMGKLNLQLVCQVVVWAKEKGPESWRAGPAPCQLWLWVS